jgi:hypothetical protein
LKWSLGRVRVICLAASGLTSVVCKAEYSFGHWRQQSRAKACSSSLTYWPNLLRSKIGFSFILVSVSIVLTSSTAAPHKVSYSALYLPEAPAGEAIQSTRRPSLSCFALTGLWLRKQRGEQLARIRLRSRLIALHPIPADVSLKECHSREPCLSLGDLLSLSLQPFFAFDQFRFIHLNFLFGLAVLAHHQNRRGILRYFSSRFSQRLIACPSVFANE